MPRTRLGPRTALRLAYACDAEIAVVLLAGIVLSLTVASAPGEGRTVTGTVPA